GRLGNQPVAAELLAGLRERDIGRRQDVVGHTQGIVRDMLAGAHEREQLLERLVEAVLVVGVDRGDDGVVELVELRVLTVVQAVLALARDPDDHWASPLCSWPPSSCPCGGALPDPSSAFIWASSSSTTDFVDSSLS